VEGHFEDPEQWEDEEEEEEDDDEDMMEEEEEDGVDDSEGYVSLTRANAGGPRKYCGIRGHTFCMCCTPVRSCVDSCLPERQRTCAYVVDANMVSIPWYHMYSSP